VGVVFSVVAFVLLLFLIFLVGRLVLEWVQVFAREWKPRGASLVLAETVYTVTDPPLRGLRRVVKPIRLGSVQLDLAFLILALGTSLLWNVFSGLAAASGA
jgi:YggT family protein